jgi:GNAT superfamily N-acetyltransferase
MFDYFVLGYYMAREAMALGELRALVKRQISWNRLLTPVEMDLSAPLPNGEAPNSQLCFVELHLDDLRAGKWIFSMQCRGIKALYKVKRGIRGFAVVQGSLVIGDVWFVFSRDGKFASHPDLKTLGLTCADREVYAFDMLIDPSYRGKNLAVPLQRALQRFLKEEGFLKVYGAFYDDNLPALWMHRMLRYKELPKRRVSRFFIFNRSVSAKPGDTKTKEKAINQTI